MRGLKSRPLILLVDDDPNDEELAQIALVDSNVPHDLIVKRDGAEALAWVDGLNVDLDTWPSLVILDLKLPKISGLDVIRKLRSNSRSKWIPIVVFTSSSEVGDLNSSYGLGANAYIRKPISFDDYRATINDICRFWVLRNETALYTIGVRQ